MYPRLIERLSSVGSLKKGRGDLNNLTNAEVQGAGWIPDARAKFASAEPRRIFIWQPQSHGHCHYLRQAVLWKRATMDFKPALCRSHERGESLELLETFSWTQWSRSGSVYGWLQWLLNSREPKQRVPAVWNWPYCKNDVDDDDEGVQVNVSGTKHAMPIKILKC